jgi:L-asparaginase
MRTSSDEGWDGPRNLLDAASVAASPDSAGRGAMVVFHGQIFSGETAVKTHATDLAAFSAPHATPIGSVEAGRVAYAGPPARDTSSLQPEGLGARVALVSLVIGDDGTLLDLARPEFDGVVVEAFGSGNMPPGAVPAVRRWLDEGKPVVLASRCARGEVTPLYAFEGGGARTVAMGAIPAGPRTPSQARLELVLALSAGVAYRGR